MKVMYVAAHGGFAGQAVPLGGGAAIFDRLSEEWGRTTPFQVEALTPAVLLSGRAPRGSDLVSYSETEYAEFCRKFSRAATETISREDPHATVVLSNDIAEGPDFRSLHARGFQIATILHVDVVNYIAEIYLRGKISPARLVRWHRTWERAPFRSLTPLILRLIFENQRACLECSRFAVLPSIGMRDVLHACYPEIPLQRLKVLPWGAATLPEPSPEELAGEINAIRSEFAIAGNACVLLTLSRISPEKGTDLFLDALLEWERRPDYPTDRPLVAAICGEAAYMQGRSFYERIRMKAAKLRRTRAVFPGYVTGLRKLAFLRLADLYVFPSRHESYGLTLLEAMQQGLPAVCLEHSGARSVMREEFGSIIPTRPESAIAPRMATEFERLLADGQVRSAMGKAGQQFAATQRFETAAALLAEWLREARIPQAAENSDIT